MKLMYKCHCMDKEREIEVTARPHDGDLIMWMTLVVSGTIAVDHNAISPHCKATVMEYAKIPVDENAEGIGMKPRLSS